ncbi:MAG: efflux RND transporter periplasmic adaptor subunit [Rubrivivax sp.]|nr:efflux RND transporter periplasmic adaptor subunit [Rubrivivax sp.]
MPPMPVAVRVVQQQTVPVLVEAVGQAEGAKEVEVRARVGGVLQRWHYREGEPIRAGAPMFTIERAPFEIAVAQARAAVAQEEARVAQARRESARLKPLADMQAVSRREADDAASQLALAEAALAAQQARLREAELNLGYTAVAAPISGIATRAEKSEGSLVSVGDGLLARIVQTDPIWVRFSLSVAEYAPLKEQRGAPVRLLGADGKPLGTAGRLNYAAPAVDARLGTVSLRAEFANPGLAVLPGQFVRTQVQSGTERAWLVPQAAVQAGDQGKFVWVIREGKAAPTPIEVGGWVGDDWAVRKGLQDGDAVILDNLIKMRPGAPVQSGPAGAGQGGAPGAPGAPGGSAAPSAGASAPGAVASSAARPAAAASR